ncbi:hypothetical protein BD626DRAFT_404015 [Schizophyllum amplum]|uniref:Uncharacterized protein n=1 Tax=Schizophyllum amplum TaxID=97359 RepID=A0A550CCK4_9AGAR|nr:hypothetical protein BD626DRAFT_404015 [Auriculariopsis ampla]
MFAFEDLESCLVCGKQLKVDGTAYCSDECQSLDTASPCMSSASSALSSPHIGYAPAGDVPALVPSALGSALSTFRSRNRYSMSSSSASSTAWSAGEDEDDEDDDTGVSEYSFHDGDEVETKAGTPATTIHHPAISYARRPSGTNTRSVVPQLHRRTSSQSSSGHVRGTPQSVPINSRMRGGADDEDLYSDCASSREESDYPEDEHESAVKLRKQSTITKAKRSRNRASLPAYFSLLQMDASLSMGSPKKPAQRQSPTTPRLSLAQAPPGLMSAPPTTLTHCTPRGRRRDPDQSRSSDRDRSTRSTSRSRHETIVGRSPPFRSRTGVRGSVEKVYDWANVGLLRGRTAVRRNSSPPPKMQLRLEERVRGPSADDGRRGRARVEDLDGIGTNDAHPGLGWGRTGLMRRERSHHRFAV